MHETPLCFTLFFVVSGFLPRNRPAVMSVPPGDASFSA